MTTYYDDWGNEVDEFPSPCGEEVMKSDSASNTASRWTNEVSVPLRGRGHEIIYPRDCNRYRDRGVSVPLRGRGHEMSQLDR